MSAQDSLNPQQFDMEHHFALEKPHFAMEDMAKEDYPNVKVSLSNHGAKNGSIHLDNLEVPKRQRNKGIGNQVMKDLTSIADYHQAPMTLTPASYDSTPQNVLENFYSKHGFVRHDSKTMRREPKK